MLVVSKVVNNRGPPEIHICYLIIRAEEINS